MKGWAGIKNNHPETGIGVLGVEAVAEGAGVALLCAAAGGERVFLPGTNKERIGGGHKGKGLLWAVRDSNTEHKIQF